MATTGRQIVVGFSTYGGYKRMELDKLTDRQLYEWALCDDENAIIYDSVKTFFKHLNDDFVDTENVFYYPITID